MNNAQLVQLMNASQIENMIFGIRRMTQNLFRQNCHTLSKLKEVLPLSFPGCDL